MIGRQTCEWHELDEAYRERLVPRHVDKVQDLRVIQTLDDDHVELHALQWLGQGNLKRAQHGIMATPTGHDLELERIQRIETANEPHHGYSSIKQTPTKDRRTKRPQGKPTKHDKKKLT
jgi:hypothetical protein